MNQVSGIVQRHSTFIKPRSRVAPHNFLEVDDKDGKETWFAPWLAATDTRIRERGRIVRSCGRFSEAVVSGTPLIWDVGYSDPPPNLMGTLKSTLSSKPHRHIGMPPDQADTSPGSPC